ncbi:hypothetical protein [Pseudomonas aestiva]|uniref:hypothetical protein n=1 Tax=Pseudomonas aestiva TaxID=3136739 RepID=UPI003265C086
MNPETADRYLLNLGSLGDWVSGIGALLAVVVTLWLAHRQSLEDTESLKVQARMVVTIEMGQPCTWLELSAVSNGKRPATVTAFGFTSKHSEDFLGFYGYATVSQPFPMMLQYGQKGSGLLTTSALKKLQEYIEKDCGNRRDGLEVFANTTLGNFCAKIDKNVYAALDKLLIRESV